MNNTPNQDKQKSNQQIYSTLRRISGYPSPLITNKLNIENNNLRIANSNI
jgi:hypothetical protein